MVENMIRRYFVFIINFFVRTHFWQHAEDVIVKKYLVEK